MINSSNYFKTYKQDSPIIPIQTSRGCPHNCNFCAVTKFFGKKIRYRPIEDVIEEVTRSKGEFFFFTDDNFCANRKRTIEMCRALEALKIKYACQIDVLSTARPDIVEHLARSGCFLTYIGFESLDQDRLASMNKGFNKPKEYTRAISLLNKFNINVWASNMVGFEYETYDHIRSTVDFFIQNRVSLAAFYPLSPFPGTELYENLKADGKLIDDQWWLKGKRGNELTDLIKTPKGYPTGINLRYYAFRRFYSLPSIARRYFIPGKNRLISLLMNLHIRSRIQEEGVFPL